MGDWVVRLIDQLGYLGVGFLMFLETIFPPIPSEVIMPVAGVAAAKGQMSLAGVIAAGTAGAMLGNVVWYLAARALKPGGIWRIATDWSNYAVHVREVLAGSEAFENLHEGEHSGDDSPLTQVWESGVESLVGGAPVTQEYADAVGADAYAADASQTVKKAKALLQEKRAKVNA